MAESTNGVIHLPRNKQSIANQLLLEHCSVAYQPMQLVNSRRFIGVEIFARWSHPHYGELSAPELIELAEERGIIDELTVRILQQALPEFKLLCEHDANLSLSVNVSPASFQHPSFLTVLIEQCKQHGIHPNQLILEFPESVVFNQINHFIGLLEKFRKAGFKVALDDFGTADATATTLAQMHLHQIKVDISVIANIHSSKEAEFLAKAVMRLAHQTGVLVTAEGIEDIATLNTVAELGFDIIQGFQISRPLTIAELCTWVAENKNPQTA
ncbi:EAL domain-containing protein [Aliidiomarina sp.]|uniref:EAL domain-containing protein n=1 Tax=Aliidiomarina sp. TaxID=1872439 RepID=UPI003A4E25CD